MATAPILDDTQDAAGPSSLDLLTQLAQTEGDLSSLFDEQTLTTIGSDFVTDYERDLGEQDEWRKVAEKALRRANQEREELDKAAPPYRKSNVHYPILAVAALQFNARSYPAICKPGNMVRCKVIGSDSGRPQTGSDGVPLVSVDGKPIPLPQAQQLMAEMQVRVQATTPPAQPGQPAPEPPQLPQPQPLWAIEPGAKQKRADRVADYLNTYLQYRMENWEEDTDQLLFEIAIVGCGFRKLWWNNGKQNAAYVSALDLVVPIKSKTLADAPRTTERLNDVFPFQIRRRMNAGEYRYVELPPLTDDTQAPRLLLEGQRWLDLDADGVDEPYIITIDHETRSVLRIVANFGVDEVHLDDQGRVIAIDKGEVYVKYPFLPHARHVFYGQGFGHLVDQLQDIVDTSINQMNDAGHAAIAGGGFIASGVRLQGNKRSETIRFMPGEYKNVDVAAGDLRAGIVERTFPQPSPIMFQLFEIMLAASKDITNVKDILTGDVPNTAPVGTTLAIVEQAQTVFTAIYKRVYRSAGQEVSLIADNLGRYGGNEVAQDYLEVLDDITADFHKDFAEKDMDIKPTADPANVTSMQRIAKAQFLLGFRGTGLNDIEINKRALEAGGIEDIDALLPQGPAQPDPLIQAKIYQTKTAGDLNLAKAAQSGAAATKTAVDVGHQLGESEGYGANSGGGVSGLAGAPGNAVGAGGAGGSGDGAGGDMGAGAVSAAGV
jgi:chaperonin GroES